MHDPRTISERARWALSRMIADGVQPTPPNYAAYFEGRSALDDPSGEARHLRHVEDCEKRCHDLLDAPAAALSNQADRLIQATVAHRAQLTDGRQNIEANLALAHAASPKAVDSQDARVFITATAEKVVLAIAQAQSTLNEYALRIADLKAEVDRTRAIVRTDALTGAINQGGMRESAQEQYDKASRDGVGLIVVAIDLDDFRAINNTYGHPVGDRVLQCFARRVRQSIRQSDVFIRSGGEEFLLIFPDADANGAAYVVDRIRASFEKPIEMKPGSSIGASFSAGLAAWRPGESVDSVIDRADAALLEAKRRGKRRNVLWHEGLTDGVIPTHG